MSLSIDPAHSSLSPNRLNLRSKCELLQTLWKSISISDPKKIRCTSLLTRSTNRKLCEYIDLHNEVVPYREAWGLQKAILGEKKALIESNQECCDSLIILQHNPVYTLGTGSSDEFLNFDINNSPIDIVRTERGGEVTYHGPGQLVMYPIINLRNHKMDLHWYLRNLEEVVIRTLERLSINASRLDGLTGVWVGDEKLAAIGIRVSQWITYHGLALNVSTDLSPFKRIVPCGIRGCQVGSIKGVLGRTQARRGGSLADSVFGADDDSKLINITCEILLQEFAQVFQLKLEPRSLLLKPIAENV